MNKQGFGGYFPWKTFIITLIIGLLIVSGIHYLYLKEKHKEDNFNRICHSICLEKGLNYQTTFDNPNLLGATDFLGRCYCKYEVSMDGS